jgi:hypothetical protein
MRGLKIKALFVALCLVIAALFSTTAFAVESEISIEAEDDQIDTSLLLSRGLIHIYKNKTMAKSGVFGNDIYFEKQDFQRVFNMSDAQLQSILITKAPAPSDGELRIGSSKISDGQKISAENIAYLTFVPASDSVSIATFEFSPNGGECPVSCELYFTEKENSAPSVSKTVSAYNNVMTYKGYTLEGRLTSSDAEGDEIKYVIVKYPEHGSVILTDASSGKYEYVHSKNYTGKDSFSYCAVDKYGNWSDCVNVTVNVRAMDSSAVKYEDLDGYANISPVIHVAENDVMSGMVVGSKNYFYPEKSVSRAEFVVMAMHALGIDGVSSVDKTEFEDDESISSYMKGYIQTAYENGYVTGNFKDGKLYFEPDAEITRSEAAAIICAMTDISSGALSVVYGDEHEVPAWAEDSVSRMVSAGIFGLEDGYVYPERALNKLDCAQIFSKIMIIKNTD